MAPMILTQPQEEPIIMVTIDQKVIPFMVDTGAIHSCIGRRGAHLPMSASSVKTVGFSGNTQVIPLTQPVPILIAGNTIVAPLLYSTLNSKLHVKRGMETMDSPDKSSDCKRQ